MLFLEPHHGLLIQKTMHHRRLDRWFQFGGHCDEETDVLAVAIKEAKEETGIINIVPMMSAIFDLDIHFIPKKK